MKEQNSKNQTNLKGIKSLDESLETLSRVSSEDSYQNKEINILIQNTLYPDSAALPIEISEPENQELLTAVLNGFMNIDLVKESLEKTSSDEERQKIEYILKALPENCDNLKRLVLPIKLENDHTAALYLVKDDAGKISASYIDPIGLDTPFEKLEPTDQKTIFQYSSIPMHIVHALDFGIEVSWEEIKFTRDRIQKTHFEGETRYTDSKDSSPIVIDVIDKLIKNELEVEQTELGFSCLVQKSIDGKKTYIEDLDEKASIELGKKLRRSQAQDLAKIFEKSFPGNSQNFESYFNEKPESKKEEELRDKESEREEKLESSNSFFLPSLGKIVKSILPLGLLAAAFAGSNSSLRGSGNLIKTNSIPPFNSISPTSKPTIRPSSSPSVRPTIEPTKPTGQPTGQPSKQPIRYPTSQPSRQPSGKPTGQPSRKPTGQPSRQPSRQPTGQPSRKPSRQPTGQPTGKPSNQPSSEPSGPTPSPTSAPPQYFSREAASALSGFGAGMLLEAGLLRFTEGTIAGSLLALLENGALSFTAATSLFIGTGAGVGAGVSQAIHDLSIESHGSKATGNETSTYYETSYYGKTDNNIPNSNAAEQGAAYGAIAATSLLAGALLIAACSYCCNREPRAKSRGSITSSPLELAYEGIYRSSGSI